MEPASSEKLLEAFETLDPENKKYLTKEYFGKLMAEEGEPFSAEELDAMWPVAIDPITGHIPYTFYINQLRVRSHFPSTLDWIHSKFPAQTWYLWNCRGYQGGTSTSRKRKGQETTTTTVLDAPLIKQLQITRKINLYIL